MAGILEAYKGFLHSHPHLQDKHMIDELHVIVDKDDWEEVRSGNTVKASLKPFLKKQRNELKVSVEAIPMLKKEGLDDMAFKQEIRTEAANAVIVELEKFIGVE